MKRLLTSIAIVCACSITSPTWADMQCSYNVDNNGRIVGYSSGGDYINGAYQIANCSAYVGVRLGSPTPAEGSTPRDTIRALLLRAEEEQKKLEKTWFTDGSALSAARERAQEYRDILGKMPQPKDY